QHLPLWRIHCAPSQGISGGTGCQSKVTGMKVLPDWLQALQFDESGLIPAIAQDAADGTILMVAWMNAEAVAETVESGHAVYWSRSRGRLWRKGEESGHRQRVLEIRKDCDNDVLLI